MRTILVAEDNPQLRKLLAIHLRAAGYEVAMAADGAEALEKARLARPDCLVSDVLMPRLDGFGLCRALRRDPRLRSLPVVLVSSATVAESDRELAQGAGASCYVGRTPDSGEILHAVEKVLAGEPALPETPAACPPGLRRRFLGDGAARCRELIDAARSGQLDRDAARGALHRWAGIGGTLGFPQISQLAYGAELELEDASPAGRTVPALEDLEALFRAALRRLPAGDAGRPESTLAETPADAEVIVADDDFTVSALLAAILKKHGIGCAVARQGRESLHLARKLRPAVLVLDINMPEMDGFEVLAALKRDPALSTTAVLMLTARQREADVLRGFGLGADDYVVKPFGPNELVARIKRLLRPVAAMERAACSAC